MLPDPAYEELMQSILIDEPRRFHVVRESEGFTKTGDHIVTLTYIEEVDDPGEEDRY